MNEYYDDMTSELRYYLQNVEIGKKIILYDRTNKLIKTSIKSVVIMKRNDVIYDVEIIINKSRNNYFSIAKYIEGVSWVQSFEILEKRDKRLKVTVG